MRVARTASTLALAVSITIGVLFLFAPLGTLCSTSLVAPGQAPTPTTCHGVSFLETQRDSLFPALIFIAVWTFAPLLAVLGTRRRPASAALVAVPAAIELAGIVSLGGGVLWALTAGPILLVALVATLVSRSSPQPAR
ncbi:MAG: hypothetical protein E6I87_00345 [Chloroflexi bacterium]|nr:MAG: hypothetical protein E6I87_00345 [Chloroflexota bacterium]